jgi:hypothetical protein
MKLLASIAKTTAAWALGTAAGGLDTGSIAANTWYHFFLIQRVDTGVVDVLFSLSATAPTLPTNYTLFRRIGSMKTDPSSLWVAFFQDGDRFTWLVPVSDTATNLTTSRVSVTLYTPGGIKTLALMSAIALWGTSAGFCLISSLDMTDSTPSATLFNLRGLQSGAGVNGFASSDLAVRTNTSSQVGVRGSAATSSFAIVTNGWIDDRGKLS